MKKMILITFPAKVSGHSYTYELIQKFDLKISILRANIDFNAQGFLLLDIMGEKNQIQNALTYIQTDGIVVEEIQSAIHIDKNTCVDCGACTAVCFAEAIYMDQDMTLQFDNEKCLDCKSCVEACPTRAIKAVF